MIPKELCHYTTKETALEKILYGQQIKLGQLEYTNDPKESFGLLLRMAFSPVLEKSVTTINQRALKFANTIHGEEWKVLCMTRNLPKPKKGTRFSSVDRFNDKIKEKLKYRYSCFAQPRMWAQYAQNHSGVCLMFDGKQLDKNIRTTLDANCEIFYGPVEYNSNKYFKDDWEDVMFVSEIKDIKVSTIREHIRKSAKRIFLTKFTDWKGESEFRWLVHSKNRQAEFVSIVGALKSVLVGNLFPEVYEPSLRDVCKKLQVPAGRLVWGGGMPFPMFGSIYDPKEV